PSTKALMAPHRITEPSERTMTPVASGDSGYALRLCEDTVPTAGRGALGALNRVLYVGRGSARLETAEGETRLAEGEAWHGARGRAGGDGGRGAGADGDAGRGVVRERSRAGARDRVDGRADELRPGRDPAARDSWPDVDHVRRSQGRRARAAARVHGVRRRADR